MLTSCSSDILESLGGGDTTDGVPVTLTFAAAMPGQGVTTRSTRDIKNLTLLVFNEKHRYLYRAKATLDKVEPAPIGITFLPHGLAHGPVDNEVYKFTVTLMTSTKPRIIHFVADYDNLDGKLADDQTLEGADEGEVIPRIVSTDMEDYSYWQSFKFDKIDNTIFNGKAFELLRDKARIEVKNEPNSGFELKGFNIHNAPDRGTIAPYISKAALNPNGPREMYRDVLYTFPLDPTETTLPPGIVLKNLGDVTKNLAPLRLFDYSNSQAEANKQMSVILYGKGKADKDYAYYKLDIVRDVYADPKNKTGYIGAQRFDIIRNNSYVVKVVSANGKGYSTYAEAVRQPASNNLFGSVELQEYSDVTDGEFTLIVDNTNAIMTLPGHFYSPITFVGANLEKPAEHVDVYYNGKVADGHIDGDDYIDHAEYNKTTGVLHVNVTNIPTDIDKTYTFNVVASPPNSVTHIQRTITLILRKRYDFKLKLTDTDPARKQGSPVNLTFTVPGTLPSTLYPFDIFIAADQLSPLVNNMVNDQMKVLKLGQRTYYSYTVRTPSTTDQEVTLHFQRTRTDGTCDVTAISGNFNNADAILPNGSSTSTNSRGLLTYTGISYTVPKIVPSEYRTTLQVSGVWGVEAKMASAGYVEFGGTGWATATGNLTLTATMKLGNGTVTATRTMAVSEWKQLLANKRAMNLEISEVTVEEKANYRQSNDVPYQPVPAGSGFTVDTSDPTFNNANISINSTGLGTYKMTVRNLQNIKKPIAFTAHATIGGTLYESNSAYLSKIIDNPVLNLTPHN
uniref:Major fimbrial subunit protein N-terminal domain-containing protein n=1 Tax=Prevotella sp. GTC17260 TaxID=3236796 RepID=A0AB33JB62_9BACT